MSAAAIAPRPGVDRFPKDDASDQCGVDNHLALSPVIKDRQHSLWIRSRPEDESFHTEALTLAVAELAGDGF